MRTKTCFKCGVEKPVTDFYKHKKMADGRLGKCKDCTKQDVRQNRAANIDRFKDYERQRGLSEHRKELNRRRAKQYKVRRKDYSKKYRLTNPGKYKAHVIVGNAIRDGSLIKQPCERCGTDKHIHAHHDDYAKPLDVKWLCRTCHGERHREINDEKRSSA